jgi:hypothetical protein
MNEPWATFDAACAELGISRAEGTRIVGRIDSGLPVDDLSRYNNLCKAFADVEDAAYREEH